MAGGELESPDSERRPSDETGQSESYVREISRTGRETDEERYQEAVFRDLNVRDRLVVPRAVASGDR